jgi:hypothetical protein
MLTGTRDYFPIAGGHATYDELKRVFGVLDAAARVGFYEHDSEHGWNQPRREATTRWLMKWLQGRDSDGAEGVIQPEPERLLNASPTGQVATSYRGTTVRAINAQLARSMYPKRTAATIQDAGELRALIARVLNIPARSGPPLVLSQDAGKLSIEVEPGLHVAAGLSKPASAGSHPAVLYVNSAGKAAGADTVRQLVDAGHVVLAIDPRGWGEGAAPPQTRGYSIEWQIAQRAMLLGKPMLGMQTFDVLRAFDYLSTLPEVDAKRIRVVGVGGGGLVALFAGALEPRIASVEASGAPQSYLSIVEADTHQTPPGWLIPGVLKHFDLPDVARAVAPRPVAIR